jgi:TP901 family phage tail tape measure protein
MALGSGLFSAGVASAGGTGTRIGAAFVEIFADTSGLRKGFAETETLMTSFGARLQGASMVASRAGSFITRNLSLPLAALGGVSVKMAADFDQAMTRTVALAGARAVGTMDELRTSVLKLSGETAQAPKDIADSLFFVASAGLKTAQVMPVLEATAQGAAAQLGDAATLGQLLTSVLVAYGKDAPTAASAMDVLTEAIRKGKAEPLDLSKSLGTVIPVAAEMGVSFDEVAAAIAASTNQGIEATRAATGLRYMLIQLANPSEQAKNILEDFGTSIQEVQTNVAEHGLVDALSELKDQFDLSTAAGKEAFFTAVGGVRAGQVALALVGKNMKAAQDITRATARAAGDAGDEFQAAFKKMTDTPAFRFQKAWNDLKIAAIDAGTALMPIAEQIVGVVADLANWFTNLSDESQDAILNIGKWIVIGGPLLKVFGGIGGAIAKIILGFRTLSTVSAGVNLLKAGGIAGGAAQIPGQLAIPGMEAAGAATGAARIGAIALSLGEFAGYATAAVLAGGYINSAFEDASNSAADLSKETNFTVDNINMLKDAVENSAAGLNVFGSKTDKVREAGTLANGVVKDLVDSGHSLSDAWAMVNGEFENSIDIVGGLSGSIPEFVRGIRARLGVLRPEDATSLLRERFAAGAEALPPVPAPGTRPGGFGAAFVPAPDTSAWLDARKQIVAALISIKDSKLDVDDVFGTDLRQYLDEQRFTWPQLTAMFEDAGLAMPYEQAGRFAEAIFRMDSATQKQRRSMANALSVFDQYGISMGKARREQVLSAIASGDVGVAQRAIATGMRQTLPALLDQVDGLNKQKEAAAFAKIAVGDIAGAWKIVAAAARDAAREQRRAQREGFGPEGDPTAAAGAAIREQRKQVDTLLETEPKLKGWGRTLRAAAEFKPFDFQTAVANIEAINTSFDDLSAKARRRITLAVRSGNTQRILRAIAGGLQDIEGTHHSKVDAKVSGKDDVDDIYDKIHYLEDKQATPTVTASVVGLEGVQNLWSMINQLPSQKTITINTVAGGVNIPSWKTKQQGGWIGGSGRGDIIPAMLEPGEFVIRREVAQRNKAFLDSLNGGAGHLAFHRPSRGGRPSSPVMSMSRSGGGAAGGGGNKNLTVNVQGRMEYTPRDLRRNLEGWWRRRDW